MHSLLSTNTLHKTLISCWVTFLLLAGFFLCLQEIPSDEGIDAQSSFQVRWHCCHLAGSFFLRESHSDKGIENVNWASFGDSETYADDVTENFCLFLNGLKYLLDFDSNFIASSGVRRVKFHVSVTVPISLLKGRWKDLLWLIWQIETNQNWRLIE